MICFFLFIFFCRGLFLQLKQCYLIRTHDMLSNTNRKYIFIRPRCFCGNDETRTRTRTCFENVPRKHNATGITGIRFWKEVCEMSPGQPPQIEADKNDCYIKYCNDKDMLKDMFCSGSNCTYTWQRSRLTSSHACATLDHLITPALV